MEIRLSPRQRAQLAKLAAERGSDEVSIASELLDRALDHEDWFIRAADKGFDRGEFLTHEEVKARIERRLGCKL